MTTDWPLMTAMNKTWLTNRIICMHQKLFFLQNCRDKLITWKLNFLPNQNIICEVPLYFRKRKFDNSPSNLKAISFKGTVNFRVSEQIFILSSVGWLFEQQCKSHYFCRPIARWKSHDETFNINQQKYDAIIFFSLSCISYDITGRKAQ